MVAGGCSLTLTGEIKNMDYKDLIVWQMGMRIAKDIYVIVIPKMPDSEKYALSNQMCRAAVSVPSNIAEGHSRESTKDYIKFLTYAKGSLAELQSQLLLCVDIGFLADDDIRSLLAQTKDLMKKLNKLLISLKEKIN